MAARERDSAELVSQQYISIERVVEHQSGAEAIRLFKVNMAHAWLRACFWDDDRFIERSKCNNARGQIARVIGVDLVAVMGLAAITVQTIISEIGTD